MKRKYLKKIFIFISKSIMWIFFDKKYLQGRWFENNTQGWLWAWKGVWFQKILGFNRSIPWPCHPNLRISCYKNIDFHVDNIDNFQSYGCYFQNSNGRIIIGKGVYIAPNVGIITSNHDLNDLSVNQQSEDVIIGAKSWIGMNSVILPGVKLAEQTIVGAGTVINKNVDETRSVVVGAAGHVIKRY